MPEELFAAIKEKMCIRDSSNIGRKPTVSNGEQVLVECYLFGYTGDAYGKKVRIESVSYTHLDVYKRQP